MNRFTYVTACWLVAFDCAAKAFGTYPQSIFSVDLAWLWWLPAAIWFLVGFGGFSRRTA